MKGWYGKRQQHGLASKGITTTNNVIYFEADGVKQRWFVPKIYDEEIYSMVTMTAFYENRNLYEDKEIEDILSRNEDAIIKIMKRDNDFLYNKSFWANTTTRSKLLSLLSGGIAIMTVKEFYNVIQGDAESTYLPLALFTSVFFATNSLVYDFYRESQISDTPRHFYQVSCKLINKHGSEYLKEEVRKIDGSQWNKAIQKGYRSGRYD